MTFLRSVASILLSLTTVNSELVEYNWTLRTVRASSKDTSFSVDCNLNRLMLFVNDEYPGPVLRAQVGDTVRINLVNEDPSRSFSLHLHGLHMRGQPYYDGTASGSQCATNVLQTQVYEFTTNEPGTHYWHGHMAMERGDGFQGGKCREYNVLLAIQHYVEGRYQPNIIIHVHLLFFDQPSLLLTPLTRT
jgi:hypothetical protein